MMKSFIPRIECFQKIKTVTKNKLANIKAKIKSSRSLALFGQTFSCEPIYTYIPSVFKTDKVMGLNNIDIPLKTLAQQAGDIMIKVRSNNLMNIKEKEDKSIVTAADSEIQELVDKTLSSLLPNSVVIGEESFSLQTIEKAKGARFVWVVDPLDGTQDYAKGEKAYCIAIILLENGYPVHSLIYAPEFDIDGKGYSLFEASRNKEGAYLNGKPIFVNNNVSSLNEAKMLLYESSKVTSPLYYAKVKKEAKEVIHNKGGSGLINVCRVASSANYPGHEVFYLKPTPSVWDVIQGAFLIRKANGKATYDDGRDVFPLNMDLFNFEQTGSPRLPSVMFGAQNIHNELLKLIKT